MLHESASNELLHTGPEGFAFLVDEHGFNGPETGANRLTYRRAGITISVRTWAWKNETGFTTTITMNADGDLSTPFADLSCLYAACGLGPLQHVPGTAGSRHTVRKRVSQHATALKAVMPYLLGPNARDLVQRCQGKLLPG